MRVVPGRFGDHLTRRTQTRSRSRRYIGTGCRRRTSAALRRRLGRRPAQAQTHPIFVVVSPPQFPACSEPALHPPQRRSTPRPLRTSLPLPATVSKATDVNVVGTTRLFPSLPAAISALRSGQQDRSVHPAAQPFALCSSRPPLITRFPSADAAWRFWPFYCCRAASRSRRASEPHTLVVVVVLSVFRALDEGGSVLRVRGGRKERRKREGSSREKGTMRLTTLGASQLHCGLRLFRVTMGRHFSSLFVMQKHTLPST
ncbi:hypothetical protein C8R45DRAFT_1031701 [Mycena sanguinolenta]|nr:hypothetical protein C8R45DRAFT_1031701 [Mycena sanguinolenta]